MALVRKCDIFGSSEAKTHRITVEVYDDLMPLFPGDGAAVPRQLQKVEIDLGKRGVERLLHFLWRGTHRPGEPLPGADMAESIEADEADEKGVQELPAAVHPADEPSPPWEEDGRKDFLPDPTPAEPPKKGRRR